MGYLGKMGRLAATDNARKFRIFFLIAMMMSCLVFGSEQKAGTHTDILYGKADGRDLLLDAFVPEGPGPFPVAIFVHGGGWSSGDKSQNHSEILDPLSKANFVWFSIDYRLAPQYRWPACLEDVVTAIRWVKQHAAEYKGDPERIALVGYSAGGHLACSAAIWAKEDTRVQAVVGFAAPIDHVADSERRDGLSKSMQDLLDRPKEMDDQARKILHKISPIWDVRPGLPPFLLIHGTADQSVPYQQSIDLQAALNKNNVPCKLITIEGAPHRISEWEKYDADYREKMIAWLRSTIGYEKTQEIVVSSDGTGDFTSVQAAVDAVPAGNTNPVVISIKPGTYKERLVVPRSKPFIRFRGEDAETTILTFDLYAGIKDENGKEIGTFRTPSVTIEADDFTAENITFENTAGDVGQAVALAVLGDRCVFDKCRFLGWQDTLLDQSGRHYYKDCYINGHCDFIFGGGTAFFENCRIHCLDASYITAASTPEHQPYGYVFARGKITGQPEGKKTYLGRPWRDYASVVFLYTEMDDVIKPEGWHNWSKPHREQTSRYAEYGNTGPGANPEARVSWARQLTKAEAEQITMKKVLAGEDGWDPIAGTVKRSLKVLPATEADAASIKKKRIGEIGSDWIYLLAAFREGGQEGLYFATSCDGLDWIDAGGPFLKPEVSAEQRFRNPCLLQGPDGMFHLVWQTGVRDPGFGYARSKDLMHWSDQKYIRLMDEQKAYDVVSPELFYDKTKKQFVVSWASTLPGNYFQAYQEDVENNPRLWTSATEDFETFTPARPFFEPGYSVQDGVIMKTDSGYALIHDDHRRMFRTLRAAFGDTPSGPWGRITDDLPPAFCESPAVLKAGDNAMVYFHSIDGRLKVLVTQDFVTWQDFSEFVSFPEGYRVGSVLKTNAEPVKGFRKFQPETIVYTYEKE